MIKEKGFTLAEIMTAFSIFMIALTLSMGSILGVFDINRKAQSIKVVMGNLNLALESVAREMRFGENYHCGSTGMLTEPQNCPSGGDFISFLSSDDRQISYRLTDGTIEKSVDSGGYVAITAPEIGVDELDFFVLGAGAQPSSLQPKVLIKVRGTAGSDDKSRTEFTLQTLVSQRVLDR